MDNVVCLDRRVSSNDFHGWHQVLTLIVIHIYGTEHAAAQRVEMATPRLRCQESEGRDRGQGHRGKARGQGVSELNRRGAWAYG